LVGFAVQNGVRSHGCRNGAPSSDLTKRPCFRGTDSPAGFPENRFTNTAEAGRAQRKAYKRMSRARMSQDSLDPLRASRLCGANSSGSASSKNPDHSAQNFPGKGLTSIAERAVDVSVHLFGVEQLDSNNLQFLGRQAPQLLANLFQRHRQCSVSGNSGRGSPGAPAQIRT
jgi:hypothetical protein